MKNVEKLPNMGIFMPPSRFESHSSQSRELPPIPIIQALAKGRHRLIYAPRLSLVVCDVLLPALLTLQRLAHAAVPLMRRICPRYPIYVQILYSSFFPDMRSHQTFISIPSLFQ